MSVKSIKKQPAFEEDAERGRIENIAVAEIRCDDVVRLRELNPRIMSDYADRMREGHAFPPVLVVLVDGVPLLADGHHRYEAAKLLRQKTLRCEVRRGDLRAAMLLSIEANVRHGLRLGNEDKRKAVARLLADAEWRKWSDREIARRCHVGHPLVAQLRGKLLPVTGSSSSERTFVTKHGTESVMNIVAIGKRPKTSTDVPIRPAPSSEASPQAGVVNLSANVEIHREQFVAVLIQMENVLKNISIMTLFSRPDADTSLRARMRHVGQSLLFMESRRGRRRP